jgi:hypothetical protein
MIIIRMVGLFEYELPIECMHDNIYTVRDKIDSERAYHTVTHDPGG